MALPPVSGEFRLVADPELRFAPSGMAVGNLRLVSNSRKQVNGEWVDDQVIWLDAVVFKQMAENVVESLSKGDLVVVIGRLKTEQWEKDGEKKSKNSLTVDFIGPSLTYATAKVSKAERSSGGTSTQSAPAQSRPAAAAVDPWAAPANQDSAPPF